MQMQPGRDNSAPDQYFTASLGEESHVPDEVTNCTISDVVFEPGARNNWHITPQSDPDRNRRRWVLSGAGSFDTQAPQGGCGDVLRE